MNIAAEKPSQIALTRPDKRTFIRLAIIIAIITPLFTAIGCLHIWLSNDSIAWGYGIVAVGWSLPYAFTILPLFGLFAYRNFDLFCRLTAIEITLASSVAAPILSNIFIAIAVFLIYQKPPILAMFAFIAIVSILPTIGFTLAYRYFLLKAAKKLSA